MNNENREACSILIVDDEPNNIQMLGMILKDTGYESEFAVSGEEALQWARRKPFDLILLDIMMPGIDGFEVCRRLKSDPSTEDAAVIFITGKSDPDSIVTGFELGAVDYVTKPFNRLELQARVRTHLALKQSRRELFLKNLELQKSEKRFRRLVNALPAVAVQGYDMERNVIFWNRASEKLYGYTAGEAMGRRLEALLFPPSMGEALVREMNAWIHGGMPIPASERRLLHKDGGRVPVYSTHVMLTGSRGEKEIYRVDVDLSEIKSEQERRKKSETFYRRLFDHSSSGVAVYQAVGDGEDFVFKDFNAAGERIEGVKAVDILGKKVTDVFPAVKDSGLLEVFRRVHETGMPSRHRFYMDNDNVSSGWRDNNVYRLPSGEIVAVYDDITLRMEAEKEKAAMEAKLLRAQKMEAIGLLAGGVAHDLNNILSGIVGYPELLLLQLAEESELVPPLKAIHESGQRAVAVVADLLTVARGVAGTRDPYDLNLLVKEYLDSPEFHKLCRSHEGLTIREKIHEGPLRFSCSSVHIKKCIMNLTVNAAEAMEAGGEILISTYRYSESVTAAPGRGLKEGAYVVLEVADTGEGIPEKDLEHIFEPFYTKKVMGKSGTGLGLAVVWNTVQDHGGSINVRSDSSGTTFTLYFPASELSRANGPEPAGRTPIDLSGNGESILVVDDEPLQLDIASRMLGKLGYKVVCRGSGIEAVDYLRENSVDLVLLDMIMDPGLNGRQTYEHITRIHPRQKAVIVSGFSQSEEVKKARILGAGGFIRKPYSMTEVARAVKECLEG